jgi:class 3 adenylate cyclase
MAIMEPRIQYAKTSDGVNVAYAVAGEGKNVARVPPVPWSHVQREWETFSHFLFVKPLANACRVAWYDSRGSGLSDRDAIDFSLDAMVRDLDAVLNKAGGQKWALCAVLDGVPIAISYAAARPERVSHLVLVEAYSKGSDYLETPAGQIELGIRDKDWVIYTDILARLLLGYSDSKLGTQFAEHLRACAEPQALRAAYDAVNYEWDVTDLLPTITAPTLVIHNEQLTWLPVRVGQRVAATLANSRFLVVDDLSYKNVPRLIAEFLELPAGDGARPSGTAVILFADIADSTGMTERIGDTAFREKVRELDTGLRAVIHESGGMPVEGKLLGDGVLAVFTSARQAIEAALRCGRTGDDAGLPLHLGLHAGDVIREGNNVYGGAVNIASRISGLSAPGHVLVSETVRSLARTSAGVRFEDRGERELKGVSEPVRLWAVVGGTNHQTDEPASREE